MQDQSWLDKNAYPFKQHYLGVPGGQLHYIDEGQGDNVLFVHGTPTWSFLWRNQITALSKNYRCIAVDHLGFGLSEKPPNFSYSLEDHRDNLARLVEHLQLENVTLVVHDFGGPIGLGWAVQQPEKVAKVVVLNSWMWPLTDVKPMMQASKLFGSRFGKFLYVNLNFSPKFLLPQAFYQKEKLTREVQQQYLGPFRKRKDRLGTWYFAKALAGETPYFTSLYNQRHVLDGKPALVLWGTKDKLIPAPFLENWRKTLPQLKVLEMETGHFLQEEAPEKVTKAIQAFLEQPVLQ
ncbi:alpha/beta fold hydrolase [Rufibacter aurantiacus]|uniref:alpha/beta fold hydrolase n=1 Tax=Rufibacter aurantiacus TaxID=2817374 RepID=UPI001B30F9B7|nr:alpha/beta fold hydrolase [Rufibacter aurantiacus]